MTERLQKVLSSYGVTSRRKAEELICAGKVMVNGKIAALGDRADPEADEITVEGKLLPSQQKKRYIMLHKPRGYVTTLSDEKGRRTVVSLVADCNCRVYPVGRLDMDSEGLLLLTNDGEFANRVMHPSHEIQKTYRVMVSSFSQQALEKLKEPMSLDGYQLKAPILQFIQAKNNVGVFEMTIHEGRNRQIRRMCEAVGMQVMRLKRIREGNLELGELEPGKWRELTQQELSKIM